MLVFWLSGFSKQRFSNPLWNIKQCSTFGKFLIAASKRTFSIRLTANRQVILNKFQPTKMQKTLIKECIFIEPNIIFVLLAIKLHSNVDDFCWFYRDNEDMKLIGVNVTHRFCRWLLRLLCWCYFPFRRGNIWTILLQSLCQCYHRSWLVKTLYTCTKIRFFWI